MILAFQEGLVPGESIAAKLEWLAVHGIDGIELNGHELPRRLPEIKAGLARFPVQATAICGGYRGWLVGDDSEEQSHFLADMQTLLECAAELGAKGVIAPAIWGTSHYLPLPKRKSSPEQDRNMLIRNLEILGSYADSLGVTVLLEPLNRYQAHCINTIGEALEIIELVSSPGAGLIADLFHMNMEESDPLGSLARADRRLAYVHLSDSNRKLPGLGHIDFAAVFAQLHQMGFKGAASVEALPPDRTKQLSICANYLVSLGDQLK